MSERDTEAFEHYEDPTKREPVEDRPRRRRDRALTQHVPVRFPASTIATVRELAQDDGMSVSAWIRHTVEREAVRRTGPDLPAETQTDTRAAVERLRQDVAELAATLERSEWR
jgi:hypothetical protein